MHTNPKLIARMGTFIYLPGAAVLIIKTSGHSAKTTKHLCILCRLTHCEVVILHIDLTLSPRWRQHVPLKCWQPPRCCLSLWRARFSLRPIHVGFLVDEVTPGQVSLQIFQFSLAILLLPMVHAALSFICVLLMLYNLTSPLHYEVTHLIDGFGGLVVSMLASGTQVCGFKPGRSRWIFRT